MTQVKIIEGPSKLDFILSLFDGSLPRRIVMFCFVYSYCPDSKQNLPWEKKYAVVINSATRTSGDDEEFSFSGKIIFEEKRKVLNINGTYSTRTRKGWAEAEF